METESLAWTQRCSFCAVYQGPKAKMRGECFSWVVKNNFPSYTNRKSKKEGSIASSLGFYTALQGVGSYWKSFTVYIYLYWLVTQRKRALQTIWYAWKWTFPLWLFSSCFFFPLKKEIMCLTQDKKPHLEDKERVMNLQQGHIIMQWPCQAQLHRWVELVSLDHKSTHGCFGPVTNIIQQYGWKFGSQVTSRKKETPLVL